MCFIKTLISRIKFNKLTDKEKIVRMNKIIHTIANENKNTYKL
jgi:hypothetical protein